MSDPRRWRYTPGWKVDNDDWQTEADEDTSLAGFVGAMAVVALLCIVLYLGLVTAGVTG